MSPLPFLSIFINVLVHLNISDPRISGNLPFSTTTEALTSHFAKITPNATRHITDKQTGRSKGFAFLEFDAYDRMKTCLKLYHHSWFPAQEIEKKENGEGEKGKKKGKKGKKDGNGDEVKEAPRKINVELTYVLPYSIPICSTRMSKCKQETGRADQDI